MKKEGTDIHDGQPQHGRKGKEERELEGARERKRERDRERERERERVPPFQHR